MLEVKLNGTSNANANTDSSISRVLKGMLRTAYGYAKDKPEIVYLYIRIQNSTTAVIYPLFQIKNKLYHMHNLHEATFTDETSGEQVDFTFDQERQLSLHKYLGNDLLNDILPELQRKHIRVPDELWASYRISNDDFRIEVSYSNIVQKDYSDENTLPVKVEDSVNKWVKELENPEEKIHVNVYDNDELLGEDFMLEL